MPRHSKYTVIIIPTYILTIARLDATRHRWVSELADYNFSIQYKPGVSNKGADGLSRMPLDISKYMEASTERVSPEEFQAVFQLGQAPEDVQTAWVSSLSANPEVIDVLEIKDMPSIEVLNKSQIRKKTERGLRVREPDSSPTEGR